MTNHHMSEEGKFRFSVTANVAIIVSILGSGFFLWTTLVQKYDSVTSDIERVSDRIKDLRESEDTSRVSMQENKRAIDDLSRKLDGLTNRLQVEEQRELALEGRVDALTSLLNQFLGAINRPTGGGVVPPPKPTPTEH
jgi:hypothetical protein